MKNLSQHINPSPLSIPQTQPLNETMVRNSAGGFSFDVGIWSTLRRFLILGVYGGTYYASEQKLAKDAYKIILECVNADSKRTLDMIVEVSDKGLAPKNDFAVFALAVIVAKGNDAVRAEVYQILPKVARIATHLFQFLEEAKTLGKGHGNGFNKAIQRWYQNRSADSLANQLVKYRNRNNWTHKDVLKLIRPTPKNDLEKAIYNWVMKGEWDETQTMPNAILGYSLVQKATNENEVASLIKQYNLSREALPTTWLKNKTVWSALIETMQPIALLRNLNHLSSVGLFEDFEYVKKVTSALSDTTTLKDNRVHPMQALIASRGYSTGSSEYGHGSWAVNSKVVDAIGQAFEKTLYNAEPTGLRLCVGIDESGSMSERVNGVKNLSAREAAGAMALIHYSSEQNCRVFAFDTSIREVDMSQVKTLKQAWQIARNGGGTSLELAIKEARQKKVVYDAFIIYTDSETWAGRSHPQAEFNAYKKEVNSKAKLIIASMSYNRNTIGDPNDPSILQIVGLDASVPQIINAFLMS